MATSTALAPPAVDYPASDGQPMAETDHQRTPLTYAVERLRRHFSGRPDVYVSGNLFIYYEAGNPRAAVAPDVFVVIGADGRDRATYRLWEEPKAPDFVLEITSRSTRREDQVAKRDLYRRLGVKEYWQYDPAEDYLEPPLQGLELTGGEYERLPAQRPAGGVLGPEGGVLALWSAVLGLELRLSERGLRFHDPRTRRDLPDLAETDERWERAERGWRRAEQERRQAEQERQRAEQGRQQAESRLAREAAARQAAQARAAELEALLRRAGIDAPDA